MWCQLAVAACFTTVPCGSYSRIQRNKVYSTDLLYHMLPTKAYKTVRHVPAPSLGARIQSSINSTCLGLLLLCAVPALLWWNEQRAVAASTGLAEAMYGLVQYEQSPAGPDAALDGSLVAVSGTVDELPMLLDRDFGVRVPAVAELRRVVEMYQMVEHAHTSTESDGAGGKQQVTEYTYEPEWSAEPVYTGAFHDPAAREAYRNPAFPPTKSRSWYVRVGTMNGFTLMQKQISALGQTEPVDLLAPGVVDVTAPGQHTTPLPESFKRQAGPARNVRKAQQQQQQREQALVPKAPAAQGLTVYSGAMLSRAGAFDVPHVGDVRVRYEARKPEQATLVGRQDGVHIRPYETSSGYSIQITRDGWHSGQDLLASEAADQAALTWIIRVAGYGLQVLSLNMIMAWLPGVLGSLPLIGGLSGSVAQCGVMLVALVLAAALDLTVIAVAWLWARPLLGMGLLAAAGTLLYAVQARALPGHRVVASPAPDHAKFA